MCYRRPMRRLPSLDGLRGLAVLLVIVHHCGWLQVGWIGVDLFFVLSGYLLTGQLLAGQTVGEFARRRVARLLPLYAVFLLVCLPLVGDRSAWWMYAGLLTDWSTAATGVHGPLVPTWSLAVEVHAYLLWPILAHRPRALLALVLTAPLARAAVAVGFGGVELGYYCWRWDALALGALAYHAPWTKELALHVAGLLALVVVVVLAVAGVRLRTPLGLSLTALASAGVLVGAVDWRWLRLAPLRRLGAVSFCLYLVHVPLLEVLPWWAALPLSYGLAELSLVVLEKPVGRWLRG